MMMKQQKERIFFDEEISHKTPNSPLHTMGGHTAYISNNAAAFSLAPMQPENDRRNPAAHILVGVGGRSNSSSMVGRCGNYQEELEKGSNSWSCPRLPLPLCLPGKSTPMKIPTTNHLLPLDLELTAGKSKSNRCRRCN
jgi:hypothetical protein